MKWLAVVVLFFIIGWSVGRDGREVVTEERNVPGPVQTVEVPGPVETRNMIPDSCKRVIDLSAQRVKAAEDIDRSSAAQLDIISKMRVQMAGDRDVSKINALETAQRALQGKTVAAVYKISVTEQPYKDAVKQCGEETK